MNKFGAVRTTVDNVTFASKREATRYAELKLLLKAGEIFDLVLQPVFELHVEADRYPYPPEMITIGKYVADFSYRDVRTRALMVEDVKGVRTALYKWKKRHVEAQYAITITEV